MKKKIISMAIAAMCTMSLSVNAFGASKEGYCFKYYSPSFSANVLSNEEFSKSLEECIKALKEQGINCKIDISCKPDLNLKPAPPSQDIPSTEDNEKPDDNDCQTKPGSPDKPEQDNENIMPDKPSDNGGNENNRPPVQNDVIISKNQTAEEAAFAAEVVKLVNEERAAYGLSALSQDAGIQAAAQIRSYEQVELFSHTRPNGSSCFTVLSENGISYRGAGENIAYGQKTPAQVVEAWMNSSGHRANILSKNFTKIGVGCYKSNNGTIYWTQLFTY